MTAEHDLTTTRDLVGELLGDTGLLARAWAADTVTLTARQASGDNDGSSHAKPGSRPPARLDLWSHVQTTLDEAHTMCADDLGVYLASDRAEEALSLIPNLLEATLGDCAGCLDCQHGARNGLCAVNCADLATGEVLRHDCTCRHRTVAKRIGQLHSTLRTALGLQAPRVDLQGGTCPQCGTVGKISTRRDDVKGDRVWCRADGCSYDRRGTSFGIGVLAAAG